MITDRFYNYDKIKSDKFGMVKGFILALFIHGTLFFIGGKYFVRPVQQSVQSDFGSVDVDLVAAVPQSDTEAVQHPTSAPEEQQEPVKPASLEKLAALPQPSINTDQSITPVTERQQESVKPVPQEEPVTPVQPKVDTAKPTSPTREKKQQQQTVKPAQRPSQGTTGTKNTPGYSRNQPPEYPRLAKQMRQEGLVILRVEMDQKGMPVQVEIAQSSGYPLLDQAALKAVKRWRFQPGRIGDSPVKSVVAIPVRFRLEDPERRSH
ncbi:conserved hypothetical protein [Candidatus Brocadia pituitae]|nr:conserved hypothetical protein [Candidatus Brocadia pituitae]